MLHAPERCKKSPAGVARARPEKMPRIDITKKLHTWGRFICVGFARFPDTTAMAQNQATVGRRGYRTYFCLRDPDRLSGFVRFAAAKSVWSAQGDDFRTFLGEFVASLTHVELPIELNQ